MAVILVKVSTTKILQLLIVLKLFRSISIKEIVQDQQAVPAHYPEGINKLIRQYNRGKISGSEYDLGVKLIVKSLDDERKKRKQNIQ